MVLVYYDPFFLRHETGHHPENAGRLVAIWHRLQSSGLLDQCAQPGWAAAPLEILHEVHDPFYLDTLQKFCWAGGGRIEQDTIVCRESYDVAALAAGAVVDAVHQVVEGPHRRALCLVRPPGHHALPADAMGFCLMGNVAIGARVATRRLGIERVLIVDWDVHHGNGTQEVFWEDPTVGFFSMHRWPFYPGTGAREEVGAGLGRGYTCNLPIEFGTSRDAIIDQFTTTLEEFAARVRPELVIISAGFDAHRLDPVGSLGLNSSDFGKLSEVVLRVAEQYADGRVVSVLEGGYHPEALAESVEIHLRSLLAGSSQDTC